jgi:hypothetical protein
MSQTTSDAHMPPPSLDDPGPHYWKDLVRYTKLSPEDPPLGDSTKLHVMNITHLLNQLARIKAEVEHTQTTNSVQMGALRETLHHYNEFNNPPITL